MNLKTISFLMLGMGAFTVTGCASKSVTPDIADVKVSREAPSDKCQSMGKLTGTAMTAKGTSKEALDDMVKEAAHKGADYLHVLEYSGNGTSVTGIAYRCP